MQLATSSGSQNSRINSITRPIDQWRNLTNSKRVLINQLCRALNLNRAKVSQPRVPPNLVSSYWHGSERLSPLPAKGADFLSLNCGSAALGSAAAIFGDLTGPHHQLISWTYHGGLSLAAKWKRARQRLAPLTHGLCHNTRQPCHRAAISRSLDARRSNGYSRRGPLSRP